MVTIWDTLQTTVEWYQEVDKRIPWERSSQLSDLRRCLAPHTANDSCPRLPRLVFPILPLPRSFPRRFSLCWSRLSNQP